ncbi:MAG: hypothetical protein CMH54_11555 [Myxococcales bacterium]|nr:hypothetical protein [Myxococcales bacterium]
MHPVFQIGPVEFPAYFTVLTVAVMAAILLAWHKAGSLQINRNDMLDLAFLMVFMGVVGSRILHVIADGSFWDYVHLCTDPTQVDLPGGGKLPSGADCVSNQECSMLGLGSICDDGSCHPGRDCFRVFKVWYGGLAFLGGVVFCIPIGIWFALRRRMGVWRVADIAGFGVPLGHALGRLGCWFAGCCYGSTSSSGLAVSYPVGMPAAVDHPGEFGMSQAVHPMPLWESMSGFLIFLISYYVVFPRRRFHGENFWWFLIMYGVARFVLEFFRSDARGAWLGGLLTTSQLIGIPLVLVGLFMIRRGLQRYPFTKFPQTDPPDGWV